MKIAIFGAGNVALANACWLSRAGHDVHVWSALENERADLTAAGKIDYTGIVEGAVAVTVSPDAESAVKDAAVVMIAAPAFAHKVLMQAAAPYLDDGQDVLVHPVTGLSSLFLCRELKSLGKRPTIVDLSTSLFTTRKSGPASVHLLRIKDVIDMAVIPASRGMAAKSRLVQLFGERFRLEPNALAISLNNHNPVYHVPPLLCNLSRADKKENWIIWENITPSVARLIKLVDDERLAVVDCFGTSRIPVDQYFRQSFGVEGGDLNEIFAAVAEKLKGPVGPQDFNHRFFLEDVPCALVFYSSLGAMAGVGMTITDNLIQIVSGMFGRDFYKEGHTLENLGLAGCSPEEILRVSREGF